VVSSIWGKAPNNLRYRDTAIPISRIVRGSKVLQDQLASRWINRVDLMIQYNEYSRNARQWNPATVDGMRFENVSDPDGVNLAYSYLKDLGARDVKETMTGFPLPYGLKGILQNTNLSVPHNKLYQIKLTSVNAPGEPAVFAKERLRRLQTSLQRLGLQNLTTVVLKNTAAGVKQIKGTGRSFVRLEIQTSGLFPFFVK